MRSIRIVLAIVVLAAVNAGQEKASVDTLGWIAGCWEMNANGRVTTERWAKPTSNLMLGTSQTVKDGKSVAFEFLRIINNGHGLIYVAKPSSAKEETAFAAIRMTATEIVFENATHDFPQRIIYRLDSKDALSARIEGRNNGKDMAMDFPMKRIRCEQP
jgi:hypothetical protein